MWYIIGILPWLIIFYMVFPELLTATLVIILLYLAAIGILYLAARLTDRKANAEASEREKAIQEWEHKWQRPHPTRYLNRNYSNQKH